MGTLIRDKAPERMRHSGAEARIRRLPMMEYKQELGKKLVAEAKSASSARTVREMLPALVELAEVMRAYARVHHIGLPQVARMSRVRRFRGDDPRRHLTERAVRVAKLPLLSRGGVSKSEYLRKLEALAELYAVMKKMLAEREITMRALERARAKASREHGGFFGRTYLLDDE